MWAVNRFKYRNFFCYFLTTLLCITVWKIGRNQRDRIWQAKADYERALLKLRREPCNPALRAKVLDLGRHYSFLSRDEIGIAIFDEVALMNDLQAAATGNHSEFEPPKASIEERLEKLEKLKQKGYISDEQYESRNSKILDDL